VWGVLFLGLTIGLSAAASNPKDQLCFPTTAWFGGVIAPDVTKGYDPADPGWRGAFRYIFGNGTSTPSVIVQGIRDSTNSNLYIAVQVNHLMDWDQFSAVVLAFDPDGNNMHKQMLVISPIQAGVSQINLNPSGPQEVDFYHGFDTTTGWGSVSTVMNPGWAKIFTSYTTAGGATNEWLMAAKLPIDPTGNNGIAATGTFGFYVNVFTFPNEPPTDPPGSVPTVPFWWPTDAPAIGAVGCNDPNTCLFTQPNTLPSSDSWGTANINPTTACLGVSVGSQVGNIYTNHGMAVYQGANEPVISRNPGDQNIFSTYVQNTMVDINGTPVAAQGITATVKIYNFGLPPAYGLWIKPGNEPGGSPIAGDPTAAMNIPSSGAANSCASPMNNNSPACTISTGPWTLNAQERSDYDQPSARHQCVLVEIDSAPGNNTLILNNTATQNMNFEPASKVERVAEISAKGYPLPPGMTDQKFDIGVMTKSETVDARQSYFGTNAGNTKGGQISQLTWEAHGCRHTNTFLYFRRKKIELCESVGAFGFIVHHDSATPVDWNQTLTGSNLAKVRNNVYSIHIPKDGVAQVSTKIEAVEKGTGGTGGKCSKLGGSAIFAFPLGAVLFGAGLYWPRRRKRTPAEPKDEQS
jgi:hypothetical protein